MSNFYFILNFFEVKKFRNITERRERLNGNY